MAHAHAVRVPSLCFSFSGVDGLVHSRVTGVGVVGGLAALLRGHRLPGLRFRAVENQAPFLHLSFVCQKQDPLVEWHFLTALQGKQENDYCMLLHLPTSCAPSLLYLFYVYQ